MIPLALSSKYLDYKHSPPHLTRMPSFFHFSMHTGIHVSVWGICAYRPEIDTGYLPRLNSY